MRSRPGSEPHPLEYRLRDVPDDQHYEFPYGININDIAFPRVGRVDPTGGVVGFGREDAGCGDPIDHLGVHEARQYGHDVDAMVEEVVSKAAQVCCEGRLGRAIDEVALPASFPGDGGYAYDGGLLAALRPLRESVQEGYMSRIVGINDPVRLLEVIRCTLLFPQVSEGGDDDVRQGLETVPERIVRHVMGAIEGQGGD